MHNRDAVPVTSCQDLRAFYEWFVVRMQNVNSCAIVIGRSWKHIASMVYFHGYITPEEWREGGFPDPNSHFTFKQDTMRTARAIGERVFLSMAMLTAVACNRQCRLLVCRQTLGTDRRRGL